MKKLRHSGMALLGIACMGLLGGCANILNNPAPAAPGRAVVSIGLQADSPQAGGERTLLPATDFTSLAYAFVFTAAGRDPVSGTLTAGIAGVELEAGTWDLLVTGKADDTAVLEGRVAGIALEAGQTKAVYVDMAAVTESGTGILDYSVSFPDAVTKGTLTVYRRDDAAPEGDPEDVCDGATGDSGTKTATGTLSLPAGYYRVALDLYKPDGVFRHTEIAQIYPGLTTAAGYTVEADRFTPAIVDTAATSLGTILTSISGLSNNANNVYFLSADDETLPATSVENNGPVTVVIDGGGRTVTLSGTGSLITVGNNVTLSLRNITLKGQGIEEGDPDNDRALVRVASGGKLELGTGARITGNKNAQVDSANGSGGGVSVIGGTFTMSGGEISGNTDGYGTYGGGGVSVFSGTFTMRGGRSDERRGGS
jgi:hypothetical protein